MHAALSPDHDDDHGGFIWRAAAGAWEPARVPNSGGRSESVSSADFIVSQMLTLYTTPVVYLAFDRIAAVDEREETTMNFTTVQNLFQAMHNKYHVTKRSHSMTFFHKLLESASPQCSLCWQDAWSGQSTEYPSPDP